MARRTDISTISAPAPSRTAMLPGDQRIAQRVTTDQPVAWSVPRRRRFKRVLETVPASIVNVSVTGLALIAATEPGLTPQTEVSVVCGDVECLAQIRRIAPSVAGRTTYALEFITPSREFIEAILDGTELAERRSYETDWNHRTEGRAHFR